MMKNKFTGVAGALMIVVFLILFFVFLNFIMPAQGFAAGEGSLYDPENALAYAQSFPTLRWFYLLYLFPFIGIAFLVFSFYRIMSPDPGHWMKIASAFGLQSSTMFLISAITGFLNIPLLLMLLEQHPQEVSATYLAITLVAGAIVYGAFFTFGLFVLIVSIIGLKQKKFPKLMNYVGILLGIAGILCIFITAMSFGVILISIVWLISLGVVLLKFDSDAQTN